MKNILSIFVVLFCLASCKTEKAPQEEAKPAGPAEWVTYTGKADAKNIVLVGGDEEYRSEEALPQLGKILTNQHGFNCTVLFAQDPAKPGLIDPNFNSNISGLESLGKADLVILMTRWRNLPAEQMQHFEKYLMAGKPIIGLRTSTHAFKFPDTTHQYYQWGDNYKAEGDVWDGGFGRLVLGERWYTHHGHHKHQSTRGLIAPGAEDSPLVNGIANGEIWGPSDVYGVRLPLPGDAKHIIMGQSINRAGEFDENDSFYGMKPTDSEVATVNSAAKNPYNPNDPMMPVAWTKSYQLPGGTAGKSFTCTTAAATDMVNEGVRRLLVNASYFLMGMEVPEKASVNLEGDYNPAPFNFEKDEHWVSKNMQVADFK